MCSMVESQEGYPEYFEILERGEFSALCILGSYQLMFRVSKISSFNLDEVLKQEFTQMVAELKQSLNFTFEGSTMCQIK